MATPPALTALARPFRRAYLTHDELTAQLRAWADAFPELTRLVSIGTTLEGRDIWLLKVGRDPDRVRPTAWVDGNVHAHEVCGSSVALAIAEDFLALLLGAPGALPPAVARALDDARLFVVPRVCPDGAEAVLRDGRYVRSNPRDRRPGGRARWVSRDVDGDGQVRLMRVRDASGELVESRAEPGLLVPREVEDEGPFFKVFPEGVIDGFDGAVPDAGFFTDSDTDLNRNFPYAWAPEPTQAGAGSHPLSEPESRAIVETATRHPEIYCWLDLHTFGGVYIRPPGDAPDSSLDPFDRGVLRQLEAWGDEHGGYPTVSGFSEFLYEPGKPLRGDLSDYAYHQRAAVALVCELWGLFAELGVPRVRPFIDHYSGLGRAELERLVRWDREHNEGRAFVPWRAVEHPQLGPVEVGGIDPRVGLVNPPLSRIDEICRRQSAFFLRLAAMRPSIEVDATLVRLGAGAARVDVTARNVGYLPTYVVAGARALPWNLGLACELRGAGVDPRDSRQELGHLEGWGRGKHVGFTGPYFQRTRGSVSVANATFVVGGEGPLSVVVSSPRVGAVVRELSR